MIDIDETVQLCLQRELHTLNEQVSNLKAGLLTWLDHLQSVLILQEEFDVKYQQVRQTLEAIEKFIESSTEVKSGNTTKQLLEESVVSLFLPFFIGKFINATKLFVQLNFEKVKKTIAFNKHFLKCTFSKTSFMQEKGYKHFNFKVGTRERNLFSRKLYFNLLSNALEGIWGVHSETEIIFLHF